VRCLTLLLLVGSALAGPKKAPECAKTPEEAVEIARTRGKLIFLTVIVDGDGENRAVIDNVFRNRAFLRIAPEFVCLYANKDDEHGRVKVRGPDGKRVLRCADCPSITCHDHHLVAMNYARGFFPGVDAKTPIHFVLDANEEVVDTIMNGTFEQGFNHVPAKTVVSRLKKLLDKHGRGLSEEQYARMRKLLTDAKAARARDKVALELEHLLEVVAFERDVVGVREAKARVKEIDAQAAGELRNVDALEAKKEWEKVLDELERIEKTYAGTLTAGAAKGRRKELEDRREVKRLLKARDLYEHAQKYREQGKPDLARKRLEKIVRLYPETKYAKLAEEALGKGS